MCFSKFTRILSALLVFLLLASAGCKNAEPATDPEPSETISEPASSEDAGHSIGIEIVSPGETVDIVAPDIRSYMETAAKIYVEGDYTSTVKVYDELGNLPISVSFTWIFEDRSLEVERAYLLLSRDEAMEDPDRFFLFRLRPVSSGEKQNIKVENLETGADYYWAVEAELKDGTVMQSQVSHFETLPGPRILHISGAKNARDLGGWPPLDGKTVLEGLVFRSAKPDEIDGDGVSTVLTDLHVHTELDLRSSTEEIYAPLKSKLNYVQCSINSYVKFLENADRTAAAIRVFANPDNYPILFHCAAGADRTGSLAFILNGLAGVGETELVMDYELTRGRFRQGVVTEEYVYDFPSFIEAVRAFPGETMQEKVHYFLHEKCGLSEMEIYNIRAMLTGHAAVFTPAPHSAMTALGGEAYFCIDPRESGMIEKVTAGEKEYEFTFADGYLTVKTETAGEVNATAVFTDGTEMPLSWK